MNNNFDIYCFSYVCGSLTMAIFARDAETADRIIEIENQESEFKWKRKRFGFKRKFSVSAPPLDVELNQFAAVKEGLERRRAIKNGTYHQSEEEKEFFARLEEACERNKRNLKN